MMLLIVVATIALVVACGVVFERSFEEICNYMFEVEEEDGDVDE